MLVAESRNTASKAHATAGLKTAINILEKWVSVAKPARISCVFPAVPTRGPSGGADVCLDRDQLTRVSLLMNIHAALRVLFGNSENLNGFMGMKNHKPFFNGGSPLEVIGECDIVALYEAFRRPDVLRGVQW